MILATEMKIEIIQQKPTITKIIKQNILKDRSYSLSLSPIFTKRIPKVMNKPKAKNGKASTQIIFLIIAAVYLIINSRVNYI